MANIRLHPIKALDPWTQRVTHYGDLSLVAALVVVAVLFGSNAFSPVRFDREKIEIWAFDGQIQVCGLYHYRNRFPLPLSFSLGVPFPADANHNAPSTFSISEVDADGTALKYIATRNYHGTVVFRLWLGPRQDKWIRVDYLQGSRTENGRYILLSTREWKRPLDFGEYILHLGKGLDLASSNFPLRAADSESLNFYSFSRSQFLPKADWDFSWRAGNSPRASQEGPP